MADVDYFALVADALRAKARGRHVGREQPEDGAHVFGRDEFRRGLRHVGEVAQVQRRVLRAEGGRRVRGDAERMRPTRMLDQVGDAALEIREPRIGFILGRGSGG